MTHRVTETIIALCISVLATTADGQQHSELDRRAPRWVFHRPYYASTAGEGLLRGQAALIEAAGRHRAAVARAALDWEAARSKAIENRQQEIETHFKSQRRNRTYRDALRGPRTTRADAERFSRARVPRAATNPTNPTGIAGGPIPWPETLQDERFAAERARLQRELLTEDDDSQTPGSSNGAAVDSSIATMVETLRGMIDQLSATDYLHAKRFLQGLAFEARLQPSASAIAAN